MKKTKLFTSIAALALVLGLGACEVTDEDVTLDESGEVTTTDTDTGSGDEGGTGDEGDTPSEGGNEGEEVPTLLGFEYEGINYYIDGTMIGSYTYEGKVTANIDEAIPVNCTEAEDDGYYLTFELDNTTYYVCIIVIDGGYTDLQYTTEPNAIYYDEDLDGWVNKDGTYFLCYNTSWTCFYASKIEEYGPNGSKGVSPIAHLYDYPTIEGIALSAESTEVAETQSLRIDVTYTPSTIGASNLEWESSDEEVATVKDGVVTGIAVGEVTITATTLNGLTDTITLEVVAALEDEELSIEITPESLAAEYDCNLSSNQKDVSGNTSTYGSGAFTIAWANGGGTGIKPWNGINNTSGLSTIRIYSSAYFTVSNGTGSVSRVVIDAAYSDSKNGCGTSFSATNATVGTAVTTSVGDQVEITLNSGATSTTITRSGSVCYCTGIVVYYYAV